MLHKKINLNIGILLLLLAAYTPVSAQLWWTKEELEPVQGQWEFGVTAGANNFLGDLGGNKGIGKTFIKDYTTKTIKPLIGFSASYNSQFWLALKGGINVTAVTGADSLINNGGGQERWRYNRNLSFRSSIIEAYISADIYPVMIFNKETEITQLAPFVSIGVGVFHFNPQAQLNGQWIDLQPLHLEGQGFAEYPARKPYSLTQAYIPVSVGMKYYLNNKIALSGGVNFRHTFTDYIDDISTTYIDPNLFDSYLPAEQAIIAKQLYSRSLTPTKVQPGIEKANSINKDSYVTFFFTLSLRIKSQPRFHYGGS